MSTLSLALMLTWYGLLLSPQVALEPPMIPWPLPDDQVTIDFLVSGVTSTETYFEHTITRNITPVGGLQEFDEFAVPAIGDESAQIGPRTLEDQLGNRDVHIAP